MWKRCVFGLGRISSIREFSNGCSADAGPSSVLSASISRLVNESKANDRVRVKGFVRSVNKTGAATFVRVEDGLSSDTIQIVLPRKSDLPRVSLGSAIDVEGVWQKSQGSQQSMEVSVTNAAVLSTDSDPRYSSLSSDQLRKVLSLRTRNENFAALVRLRSTLTMETHRFFTTNDFVHIDTPVLTSNDCEGAGETFVVTTTDSKGAVEASDAFFGHPVFLTVSSQLHLEAMTAGIARTYTIGRAFRAERNQSSTHMNEFSMIEAEIGMCTSLDEVMRVVESYVRWMVKAVESGVKREEVEKIRSKFGGEGKEKEGQSLAKAVAQSVEFPRIRHEEALKVLADIGHKLPPSGALSRSAELALVQHFAGPVFVTHFPSTHKPFYMKRTRDGQLTESFDLLSPVVGELVGGSLRADSHDDLRQQYGSKDVPEGLRWYGEMRDRGKPPSGGFGIGFERLIQAILGVRNIKDTIPFPRWHKQCKC